jgi:hypothetical protein
MKNTLLLIGFVLLIINTACGLIFNSYDTFNMVFGDVSLVLTTLLVYTTLKLDIADGFKICIHSTIWNHRSSKILYSHCFIEPI